MRQTDSGRRIAGHNCLSRTGSPALLQPNRPRKFSSAGRCNISWWLFRNRPTTGASSKMQMFLILRFPQRTCSSWIVSMKTSEPAGTRPMRREQELPHSKYVLADIPRFPEFRKRDREAAWKRIAIDNRVSLPAARQSGRLRSRSAARGEQRVKSKRDRPGHRRSVQRVRGVLSALCLANEAGDAHLPGIWSW